MTGTTIVSYQRIHQTLSADFESVTQRVYAESVEEMPLSETEIVAELSFALQALEAEQGPPDVMISPRDQVASLLQTYIARRAAEEELEHDELAAGGLEAKFDSQDILGWAGSFFRWWKKLSPHPFVDWDGRFERLDNKCRIAVLSDWGSGLYGAPECARSIESDQEGFEMVLHLGDIYYAGDKDEVQKRFLDFWPQAGQQKSRALNGNHEMYTGGNAYFKLALKQFGQPSSFCAFENDHWVLIGLDTAYKDHDLHGAQLEWLSQVVQGADGRRVVLFSHHQPYSILETLKHKSAGDERKLTKKLAPFLEGKQIFAWYWGHEHECIIYDDHPFWGLKGRCVGHSGFPEFRSKVMKEMGELPQSPTFIRVPGRNLVPGGLVLDGPNKYIPGHEKKYVPHGYVGLEFDDERLVELYYDANGDLLKECRVV